jgi:hypothetical protein
VEERRPHALWTVSPQLIADRPCECPDGPGEWTLSNEEFAACPAGVYLLGGGLAFNGRTDGETSVTKIEPVVDGSLRGIFGQFPSDAGGTASAQVYAICLL